MATAEDVKKAIEVILEDEKAYKTSLNWAVGYCREALTQDMKGKDLYIQCLYILNNITHWRHPQANDVRRTLRKYSGKEN